MTETELSKAGCFIRLSAFFFKDGQNKVGNLSVFFPDEPEQYYIVEEENINNFTRFMVKKDYEAMRQICDKVDLQNIVYAEPVKS